MSAERVPEQGQQLRFVAAGPDDGISAWLGVLVRLLRVPASEAEGIREELESHLRERVRDLEVTGMGEEDAVRQAVSELGDVAALAQRYREARAFPRRRLLMNMSMLAMAGAAVALSVVTLSQPGERARVSVFSPPEPTEVEHAALSRKVESQFQDVALDDVFKFASTAIGMPISVMWRSLEDRGVGRESPVTWFSKSDDFGTFLTGLNDQVGGGNEWALAYRIADGAVKIGTDEYFDRQETVLASYDLSGISDQVSGEQVVEVIQTFVHSEGWQNNGGSAARLGLVGSKMFVEAPKRYHAQIKWFIEELGTPGGQAASGHGTNSQALAADRDSITKMINDVKDADARAADRRALADRVADEKARQAAEDRMQADKEEAARSTHLVKLKHQSADNVLPILRDLVAGRSSGKLSVASDPLTNSIVLNGAISEVEKAKMMMAMLDDYAAKNAVASAEVADLQSQLKALQDQLAEYRRMQDDRDAAQGRGGPGTDALPRAK